MPFIGAQPATTFAKATSQVFTNANGNIVDFTLNKHVSNPEDIEVFVANIQQQPTTSYTILSDGVTLRFSEAPPSGDFYVVYRNLAQQTGTDTGAFRKTGGSISDAVYVTGNDSSYTQASGNATSTLSVINSSYTNSGNGVLYVKQGAATNQPTMTIEQTGEGGNPGDKQGLLIKNAGQNQGDGRIFRIETTNSNLASGNTFSPLTVWNGGYFAIENRNNETSFQINYDGLVQETQIPASQSSMNINGMNQTVSGNANYVVTGLTSAYYNSYSLNNSGYFDTSTSKFEVPSGQLTCRYFVHFQTLIGITRPSSGTNYGYIAIRVNGNNTSGIPFASYREITSTQGTGTYVWETINVSGVVQLAATDYIEPIFSGSNVAIRIHSGTYTSFSVVKIG